MTEKSILSPRAACLGRVIMLLFGLALALVLVEIAGRLVFDFDPLPGWAQDFNNRVGYELRPYQGYEYISQSDEFAITVKHNSRGLHDVEHILEKPVGVFRILILADSYGHAREVPLEAHFARQLEALLNDSAPEGMTFEVINAGHFGLGTVQEYLYYTTEGYRYDPDLVLLGFYVGNDVLDNYGPLIRQWNAVETVDFPHYEYVSGTLNLIQPGMDSTRRFKSWLRQNIFIVNTLAGSRPPDRVEVGDPTSITDQTLYVPMGIYLKTATLWDEAWGVVPYALRDLRAAVEADDAQFGVFVIPDRRQIYDADWESALTKLADLDPAALDREQPTRRIMDVLASEHIPALNLLDPFRATDERLYFEIDGHWNEAGHTLTAKVLADWLRDEALIVAMEDGS
ncbi:MAG: hypothetical protein JXA10_12805 [Anaerolineae bacterium]|nr:hypothetical protein [Anaerolineae bacterium]